MSLIDGLQGSKIGKGSVGLSNFPKTTYENDGWNILHFMRNENTISNLLFLVFNVFRHRWRPIQGFGFLSLGKPFSDLWMNVDNTKRKERLRNCSMEEKKKENSDPAGKIGIKEITNRWQTARTAEKDPKKGCEVWRGINHATSEKWKVFILPWLEV